MVFDDGKLPLMIAGSLPRDIHLTVVTHSFAIASLTFEFPNVKLLFVGGTASKSSQITTGADVIKKYNSIYADLSFLAVRNLHPEFGVTHSIVEEAEIKSRISEMSTQLVAVTSPESLNTVSTMHVCDSKQIDYLVVDLDPHNPLLLPFLNTGISSV